MENELTAKNTAKEVLQKYRISHVSLDELIRIIQDQGFDVVDYDPGDNNGVAAKLINELNLQELARRGTAFTYQKGEVCLVFVNESMSAEEKLYALSHELGHIKCNHLLSKNTDESNIMDEYEANEFAHYILHPDISTKAGMWINSHRAISVAVLLLIIAIPVALIISNKRSAEQEYYGEYYITVSGEKYHTKDCYFIKDKDNIHRMTTEEYDTGEYEPCQFCVGTQ